MNPEPIIHHTTRIGPSKIEQHGGVTVVFHGLEPPMEVSQADQEHMAAMRQRSYELAVARGHIRR